MRFTKPLFALVLPLLLPGVAAGQDASHLRRGRVMFLTAADAPAVLVGRDRAWVPALSADPVSVCPSSGTCAAVRERGTCAPPACPGPGILLIAFRSIADVGELPDDADDFDEELAALGADPFFAPVTGAFGAHPDRVDNDESSESYADADEPDVLWRQSAGLTVGTLDTGGPALVGAEVHLGFRATVSGLPDDAAALFETILGDRLGIDLGAHWWSAASDQGPGHVIAIGAAPVMANRIGRGPFVVPAVLGLFLPELGGILRPDRDPAFYVRLSVPVSVLLGRHPGLEARLSAYLVDAWKREETTETLFTASVALTLR